MADEEDLKEQKKQSGLLEGVMKSLRSQNKVAEESGSKLEKAMRDLVDNTILDTKATLKDIDKANMQIDVLKEMAQSLVAIESIMALERLDRQRHSAQAGQISQVAGNMVAGTGSGSGGGGDDKGLADNDLIKKLGIAAAAKSLAGAAKGIAMMGIAIPAFFGGMMVGNAVLDFADKNTDWADMNFSAIKKAAQGFASVITEMDEKSLLAIAGIIGISGFAGTKSPAGAALSVGTMGAAISAFLGGLILGNAAIGMADESGFDLNFGALKKAFGGFASAIQELDINSVIILGGIIGLAGMGGIKGSKPTDVAKSIAATGAGIVGFLGGFVIGEYVLSTLGASGGSYLDLDMPRLTKMFGGFNNAISALDAKSVVALGGVVAAGAGLAKVGGVNPLKLVGNMTAIGLGIVGLLGGFALGDAALQALGLGGDQNYDFVAIKNLLGGFNDVIASVDPPALLALGGAVVAAVALSKSGASGTTFASNMTFIGLGVAGLLGGFMLGEVAVGYGLSKLGGADFPAITSAVTGFNSVMSAMSDETKVAIGLASAIAAFIAAKGDFKDGPKFALGMTMIGLGIGGFLAGFGIGEYAVSAMEFDSGKMKEAVAGFNSVVEELSAKGLVAFGAVLGIGALITKSFSLGDIASFGLTMTSIGIGIGGFFAGFALGAYALDKLGEINYAGIQNGIAQFGIAVDGLSDRGLAAFGTLLAAGGVLTAVLSFGVAALPLAMAAIGAGIGAFIGGFDGIGTLIAATGMDGSGIAHLMKMVAKGLDELKDIDGSNLKDLAVGLVAIGPGFASLLGAKGLGVLAEGGKKLLDGVKGFLGMGEETDNGGIIGQIKKILGDPGQIDAESLNQLSVLIDTIAGKDTSGFKQGIDNIADGMQRLVSDDRGFLTKLGDRLTGNNNPFQFLLDIAEKNREITYVGNGVKNLANGMEKISTLDKYAMPDGFDAFMFDVNKQTSVLNSGARAIDNYVQSMEALYASGNVAGGGGEAVVGTVEMQNRQEILETNRQTASSGGGGGTIYAPTTTAVNSSTTNNNISMTAPPPSDRHDEMYIFRTSGNPR